MLSRSLGADVRTPVPSRMTVVAVALGICCIVSILAVVILVGWSAWLGDRGR